MPYRQPTSLNNKQFQQDAGFSPEKESNLQSPPFNALKLDPERLHSRDGFLNRNLLRQVAVASLFLLRREHIPNARALVIQRGPEDIAVCGTLD